MRYLTFAALVLFVVPLSGQEEERIGDFYYFLQTDPMTDEQDGVAAAISDSEDFMIGWRCIGGDPWVVLGPANASDRLRLGAMDIREESPRVRYRFDSHPASSVEEWLLVGTDSKLIRAPQRLAPDIIQGARGAERMVVRIWDGEGEVMGTAIFSMMGATRALSRLGCTSD